MRKLLIALPLNNRVARDIVRGVLAYNRRHTDWYVTLVQPGIPLKVPRPETVAMITHRYSTIMRKMADDQGIRYVVQGEGEGPGGMPSVEIDEIALGRMAAEHLAGLGLKNFAFVGNESWQFTKPRCEGFAHGLASLGLRPPEVFFGEFYSQRRREFEQRLQRWLLGLPRPCGLLVANDYIGSEVIPLAQLAGLNIPDDLAVLGVDDDDLAVQGVYQNQQALFDVDESATHALHHVPLSSIVQPLFAIGHELARLLHQYCDTGVRPASLLLPPVRVIARASSDLIALDDPDIAQAVRLIRDHAHEPIDVAWIAEQLPLSRRSLERKFREMVGQTILERIHTVRFTKIKELLVETDLPLKSIATRTGISNAKWLSDAFLRFSGMTPSQYRQQFKPVHPISPEAVLAGESIDEPPQAPPTRPLRGRTKDQSAT